MFAGVEFGKRYPLRFVPCSEESNLVSLDYQFKPVINLDPSQRGKVTISKKTDEVRVELANLKDGTELFKGQLESKSSISGSSDKMECVLRFVTNSSSDGNGTKKEFEMCQISTSVVNLRHIRDETFSAKGNDINKTRALVSKRLTTLTGSSGGAAKKRKTAAGSAVAVEPTATSATSVTPATSATASAAETETETATASAAETEAETAKAGDETEKAGVETETETATPATESAAPIASATAPTEPVTQTTTTTTTSAADVLLGADSSDEEEEEE